MDDERTNNEKNLRAEIIKACENADTSTIAHSGAAVAKLLDHIKRNPHGIPLGILEQPRNLTERRKALNYAMNALGISGNEEMEPEVKEVIDHTRTLLNNGRQPM